MRRREWRTGQDGSRGTVAMDRPVERSLRIVWTKEELRWEEKEEEKEEEEGEEEE